MNRKALFALSLTAVLSELTMAQTPGASDARGGASAATSVASAPSSSHSE